MELRVLGHSVYRTEYHIVWIPKYRRRILNPGVRGYLHKLFPKVMKQLPGCEIVKVNIQVDQETPRSLDLHLILDNYGTHSHPYVEEWFQRHPRFHLHFTPTSSSWLNLIERWFAELTRKRIKRGVFRSVPELVSTIQEFIRTNNDQPQPFVWTKRADQILEKLKHCKAVIETLH